MEETGGGMKIEKLTDSNYHAWKQKIFLVFTSKDLDMVIEEKVPECSEYLTENGYEEIGRLKRSLV